MEIVVWIIIGLVALVTIAALVMLIIRIAKMKPEEREELIVQVLIGLVTAAENYFVGEGRGQEKIAWVQEQFNKTAPWFVKIVLMVTKTADFNELVKKALEQAKATEWDKFKK
jgi:phosphoglycerol transferase MdoB-like AlkP superfamily enzyme